MQQSETPAGDISSVVVEDMFNEGNEEPVPGKTGMNQSPEILSLPITSPNLNDAYVYPVYAMDPDGDILTWDLETSPIGMNIDAQTGLLYGADISPGNHPVTISVSDGKGGSSGQSFILKIPDDPVIYSIAPNYTFSGTHFRYKLGAYDPNELNLIYSIGLGPAGMIIDPDSGLLEWNTVIPGLFDVEISVVNSLGKSTSQAFTLTVLNKDGLKIVSKPETEGFESQLYQYQVSVLSNEDTAHYYSLNSAPPGMSIEADSGLISWIPGVANTYTVDVEAMNTHGFIDVQRFDIVIYSLEEMDQMFNEIIEELFQKLADGNIAGTSQYLSAEAQLSLIPVLEELFPYMQSITNNFSPPVRLTINRDAAEYITSRIRNGEKRTFIITFVRNSSGEWKLHSM